MAASITDTSRKTACDISHPDGGAYSKWTDLFNMKNAVYAAVTDIFIDPDDLIALIHMAAKIKGFDLHSRAFKSVITTGYNPAEKARYAELMLSGY